MLLDLSRRDKVAVAVFVVFVAREGRANLLPVARPKGGRGSLDAVAAFVVAAAAPPSSPMLVVIVVVSGAFRGSDSSDVLVMVRGEPGNISSSSLPSSSSSSPLATLV